MVIAIININAITEKIIFFKNIPLSTSVVVYSMSVNWCVMEVRVILVKEKIDKLSKLTFYLKDNAFFI